MKFGKSLSNQIEETIPEWREKFLSYKFLKKRLKLLSSSSSQPILKRQKTRHHGDGAGDEDKTVTSYVDGGINAIPSDGDGEEEEGFMALLQAELDKFNAFFLEKEEDYVIRQKDLQDRLDAAVRGNDEEELMAVRREIVDFHGEMVLLENYSALNYTGMVKILKKYEKRTGDLIRSPFLKKVLEQPFFTTDILSKLLKDCETMLDRLFPKEELPITRRDSDGELKSSYPVSSMLRGEIPDLHEIEQMQSSYMKSTVAALRTLKDIRKGSSTVSMFSLPPLHGEGPIPEQAAE